MATLSKTVRDRSLPQDYRTLDKMVRAGVSKDVASLAKRMLPEDKLVGAIFGDLQTQANDAARATRLAYLVSLAEDVFGDRKAATAFMTRHHSKLGATPMEKLETEWGGREVERLLQSAIHGLPA